MTERLTQEAKSQRTLGAAGVDAGEDRLHALALRMARACRHVIQGCLREEEWLDADEAFFEIILAELQQLQCGA
jgi:hypothetical protein